VAKFYLLPLLLLCLKPDVALAFFLKAYHVALLKEVASLLQFFRVLKVLIKAKARFKI